MAPSNGDKSERSDDDTGEFQFNLPLESEDGPVNDIGDLSDVAQERLFDLVRLEPTNNSDLMDRWGLDSGSEVHSYLESNLKPYYYRDDDSYIRAKEEAKDFVLENGGLYQDVTEQQTHSEDVSENIRNRDLLMDLVAISQSLGHLPSESDLEQHSNYSPDRFREEFGDLFEACKEAGIVPDAVTKSDYMAAVESDEDEGSEGEGVTDSVRPPSREELIEELQWMDDDVDGIPYPSDMNEEGAFSANTYQEEFGSWDQALDAAGIDKEQEILEDMQRVADEVGKDLTQADMNEYGQYSSSMAARYFGSWTDAKKRFKQWSSEQEDEEDDGDEFDDMVNDRLDDILG